MNSFSNNLWFHHVHIIVILVKTLIPSWCLKAGWWSSMLKFQWIPPHQFSRLLSLVDHINSKVQGRISLLTVFQVKMFISFCLGICIHANDYMGVSVHMSINPIFISNILLVWTEEIYLNLAENCPWIRDRSH